jgi:ABC-type polysaccharide/polyol phosphate transport system ATPase subunit
MAEIVIEVKNLYVDFFVQNQAVNSFKDLVMSLGLKSPFQRKSILKGVDLEIKKGECFALMGKNGSGKSTLLRTLAGIITPTSGEMIVNGRIAPMLSIGAGLELELSGYDNIKIIATLMGMNNSEIKTATAFVETFSELSKEDLKMQVKRYSAGMIARLGFSISVAQTPDILIVDEALSVGDIGFQEKCAQRINEIKKSGCSIIYVSHSLTELKRICTHGACLVDGKIAMVAEIDKVADYYESLFHQHA